MRTTKGVEKVICAVCDTPVADRQGDTLLVWQRHHGTWHLTAIHLSSLDTKGKADYSPNK
jgi:hypothetical protein